MRAVSPEPWSIAIRLQRDPDEIQRVVVAAGSPADGSTIGELDDLPDDAWISLVVRDQDLLPAVASTRLQEGDDIVILAHPRDRTSVERLFT